jgi:CDP-4-dehydro-6-deoxyglucose reductase, E3
MNYSVKNFQQLTATIYRVILQPPTDNYIHYQAGQYIEILQTGSGPKPFSIANAPLENNHCIELDIRHYPDNAYTGAIIDEIKSQKKLQLRGPYGRCILRKEPAYPLVFLAGGAGIAPIKALIEQALAEKTAQPIYLYWGARIITDFYLQNLITYWIKQNSRFHYIPVLSGKTELDKWNGATGWVHEAVIKNAAILAPAHVYASGPVGMVYAALHALKTIGLDEKFIYSDMF